MTIVYNRQPVYIQLGETFLIFYMLLDLKKHRTSNKNGIIESKTQKTRESRG